MKVYIVMCLMSTKKIFDMPKEEGICMFKVLLFQSYMVIILLLLINIVSIFNASSAIWTLAQVTLGLGGVLVVAQSLS